MTKFLLDPVYTARPSRCSTAFLFQKLIQEISAVDETAFFYMLYPTQAKENEEDWKWLNKFPDRVTLIPYPYVTGDRVEELFKLTDPLLDVLSPGYSPYWDYDFLLTSRITQIPFLRNHQHREVPFEGGTYKGIIGLEEMPMFSFRDTVSWAIEGNMDLVSLGAYMSSLGVVMNNLWSWPFLNNIARSYLTPSNVLKLRSKVREATPVKLERLHIQPKPVTDTLNVLFAGRTTAVRNFKDVAELFRKQFAGSALSKKGVKLKFLVSTHSLGTAEGDDFDFVEVRKNNREQFHTMLKEEAHVCINISRVEDFSMSTYEPMMYGVPVILPDKAWAGFVGKDYPFITNSMVESYSIIRRFQEDYLGSFQSWVDWETSYWKDFVEGPRNVSTSEAVIKLMGEHRERLYKWTHGAERQADMRAKAKELTEACIADKVTKINALELWQETYGMFEKPEKWRGTPIGNRPIIYLMKWHMNQCGWKDTLEPGVFTR
ncbi:putative glycosyltransferase protein [Rhizobium phage RHph_Y1_11]|nr:putative glycosyltransferase protein [Rhizobium phage RHph_Y1_11]